MTVARGAGLVRGSVPIILAALGACIVPTARVETPEASITVYGPADAAAFTEDVMEIAPRVRSLLGAERRPPRIRLGVDLPGQIKGWRHSRGIDLELSENLRRNLAHEFVHWYAVGVWERLPPGIEDGLANEIGVGLDGAHVKQIDPPTWEALDLALQPDLGRWIANLSSESVSAGWWVAAKTGLDSLRSLCERAEAEGLERIPPTWFLDHLDARGYQGGIRWRTTFFDAEDRELASHVDMGRLEVPPGTVRTALHQIAPRRFVCDEP